jgi:hypothetical protein
MIDLNNPDTYSVQDFGGGNILYRDTSTGLSYDPSDLTTPLSTTDVQQYGAPANASGAITPVGTQSSQSSFNAPSPSPTVNSPSSGGMNLSGLSGLFTAVGGAFATAINPPKTPAGGQPLVYNAALGTYVPASAVGASLTNVSSIPMWVVVGGVLLIGFFVYMEVKKK